MSEASFHHQLERSAASCTLQSLEIDCIQQTLESQVAQTHLELVGRIMVACVTCTTTSKGGSGKADAGPCAVRAVPARVSPAAVVASQTCKLMHASTGDSKRLVQAIVLCALCPPGCCLQQQRSVAHIHKRCSIAKVHACRVEAKGVVQGPALCALCLPGCHLHSQQVVPGYHLQQQHVGQLHACLTAQALHATVQCWWRAHRPMSAACHA